MPAEPSDLSCASAGTAAHRRSSRPLVWFLLKVVALFVVLLWPWHVSAAVWWTAAQLAAVTRIQEQAPTYKACSARVENLVRGAYSQAFATAGNWSIQRLCWDSPITRQGQPLQGILGSTGYALLVSEYSKPPEKRTDLARDIELGMINFKYGRRPGWELHRRTDTRMTGYVPTVTFLALALATPMALRRRLWTLAGGLLAVQAFIALRVVLTLLIDYNGVAPHCLYSLDSPWNRILDLSFQVACLAPATSYVVPLVLWMAWCVRRETIQRAVGGTAPGARS
jgi:hypothetical protein